MGSTYATGLNDAVSEGLLERERAIEIHLRSNHYPPVPSSMVGPCLEAIEIIERSQWGDVAPNEPVTLPEGVTWQYSNHAPASVIVREFHLDQFIQWEEE